MKPKKPFKYTPEHARKAREILLRLMPHVARHELYDELVEVLQTPSRWKEAHALHSRIRVNITIPLFKRRKNDLNTCFVQVAENAAKTAYNCSGEPAPFDADSFEKLLYWERLFQEQLNKQELGLLHRYVYARISLISIIEWLRDILIPGSVGVIMMGLGVSMLAGTTRFSTNMSAYVKIDSPTVNFIMGVLFVGYGLFLLTAASAMLWGRLKSTEAYQESD